MQNVWVIQFGLISCIALVPLALLCGPARGIPWFWICVDCSFAPAAGIPLWIAYGRGPARHGGSGCTALTSAPGPPTMLRNGSSGDLMAPRGQRGGGGASPAVRVVNLKEGMPLVDAALRHLGGEMAAARRDGTAAIKLIHGYGSSGTGGAIREDVRRVLAAQLRGGTVLAVVPGEEFGIGHQSAIDALDLCPALRQDEDYGRGNRGVTLVVLRAAR